MYSTASSCSDDRAVRRHARIDTYKGGLHRPAYLRRKGVLGVAVGGVQEHGIAALEALEVRILKQVRPKAHISAMNICLSGGQLEEYLSCSRAVVGIYQSDLNAFDLCGCIPLESLDEVRADSQDADDELPCDLAAVYGAIIPGVSQARVVVCTSEGLLSCLMFKRKDGKHCWNKKHSFLRLRVYTP